MNARKIKALLAQMDEVRTRPLNASRERVLAELRAQVEYCEWLIRDARDERLAA